MGVVMKKRFLAAAAVVGVTAVSGALLAQEMAEPGAPVPMAYINIPLGGDQKAQSEPVYGLSLNRANNAGQIRGNGAPPILDLQFKSKGVDSLKVGGATLMQRVAVQNADGTISNNFTMQEITPNQWLIIGVGVFGVLCAGEVICDDNDDQDEPPTDDIVVDDV
jgi:hypothetical protein